MFHGSFIYRGLRIFYQSNKNNVKNSVRTVIFLHGNSLSSDIFSSQLKDPLFADLQLVALDFPGHGRSEWPKSYDLHYHPRGFADMVSKFISYFELQEVFIVGSSFGGHVATYLAKEKAVRGMITSGSPILEFPMNFASAFSDNPDLGLAFKGNWSKEESQKFCRNIGGYYDLNLELVGETDPAFREFMGNSLTLNPEMVTNYFLDEAEFLNQSSTPLLVLHGEGDHLVNLSYIEEVIEKYKLDATIEVVPSAGHQPFIENLDYYNKRLLNFLSTIH